MSQTERCKLLPTSSSDIASRPKGLLMWDRDMNEMAHENGRTLPERVGALEQDMHTVKHRLDRFERHHEDIPMKVNRLEIIAANQSELLNSLSADVKAMGKQILFGLGAAGVIVCLFQLIAPYVMKGLFS